ncbi:hypothetical protein, partial [Nocardioides sp.]|uniref:hypothetical protein n=1 Tax=Nocardioides sp. TaxID=35761 RepID=UPI002B274884
VACVFFGLVAAVVQVTSWQANGRAADNTEQVVRVQEIQTSLLRADAIATTAFLVGGLEPADQRAAYDAAIDDVLRLVTDAADAQPADRQVLADLNVEVRAYTTAVAQARDYNRQNFVIGIAYLNSAGDALRSDALPMVEALVDANSERALEEMDGQHPYWLFGIGLLAVGALYLVNREIARRFHRRFNVGVAGAALGVAVLTLIVSLYAADQNGDNEATRDGPYATAVAEASARTAANDAKAQESQGLINRGSGSAYEVLFDEAAAIVTSNASPDTLGRWRDYLALHDKIRRLDDRGNWDAAVALATSTDDTSPTAALDQVDAVAIQVVDEAAAEATSSFGAGGYLAVVLAVLTLLGGLLAAAAATWGINQRRREYA